MCGQIIHYVGEAMAALASKSGAPLALSSVSSRPSLCSMPTSLKQSSPVRRHYLTLAVRAAKLPAGIEPPKEEPKLQESFLGFTSNAEIWNSRAAMIGIIGVVVVEFILKKGILEVVGLEIGKGLDLPL